MEILDAHERLARLTTKERRALMPDTDFRIKSPRGENDCWPAVIVGALVQINWLAQLETDADLLDGVKHIAFLLSNDLLDREELEIEFGRVVDELMRWGNQAEEAVAGWN